jgi:hypothetical protein
MIPIMVSSRWSSYSSLIPQCPLQSLYALRSLREEVVWPVVP